MVTFGYITLEKLGENILNVPEDTVFISAFMDDSDQLVVGILSDSPSLPPRRIMADNPAHFYGSGFKRVVIIAATKYHDRISYRMENLRFVGQVSSKNNLNYHVFEVI